MRKGYIHSFCSLSLLLTTEDSPLKCGLVLLLYCFYFNFNIFLSYFIWARFSGLHFLGDRFFSFQGAQSGSGVYPASYARVLGVFNPPIKKLGYEAGHLLPFIAAVENEGSCTSSPSIPAWCAGGATS